MLHITRRCHLVNPGAAKYQSKAKTKFLRPALVVHVAEQARLQRTNAKWDVDIPDKAVEFGKILTDCTFKFEKNGADIFNDLVANFLRASTPGSSGNAGLGRMTHRLLRMRYNLM